MDPDYELPIEDADDFIHREEDADAPPHMPPESLADFEKAIRGGDDVPQTPRIPPANAD